VTRVIVLDTGPLGIITNPRQTPDVVACTAWLRSMLAAGARVVLPEVIDYEWASAVGTRPASAGTARSHTGLPAADDGSNAARG